MSTADNRIVSAAPWCWGGMLLLALVAALGGSAWLADGAWAAFVEHRAWPESVPGWTPWAGLGLAPMGAILLLAVLSLTDRQRRARCHGGGGSKVTDEPLHLAVWGQLWRRRTRDGLLQSGDTWLATFSAITLAVGASWLADGWLEGQWFRAMVGLGLFALGAYGVYLKAGRVLPINTRLDKAKTGRARALVLPMSVYRIEPDPEQGRVQDRLLEWDWHQAVQAIDRAPQGKNGGSNLRPVLRAIEHHRETLEYLVLVRPEVGGAQRSRQCEVEGWLHDNLVKALPDCHILTRGPVDGIAFKAIYEEIDQAVERMRSIARSHGRPLLDDEIVVDITGGRAATSVAAAAVSLHNDLRFEYVDTGALDSTRDDPAAAIRSYDLTLARER